MRSDLAQQYPWYSIGRFDDLQQGDLVPRCPIVLPDSSVYSEMLSSGLDEGGTESTLQRPLQATCHIADVIIITQSCDLARDDCDQVLVCAYQSADHFAKNQRLAMAKDRFVALHMIEACESEEVNFGQQVIDFRTVYGLPKDFLLALTSARGMRPRLLPPYREHLSQSFARYFMRVGLPRNLRTE